MKKIATGIIGMLIVVALLPTFMVQAEPQSASWDFTHPWGGTHTYFVGVRINKTEPIPAHLSPRLEFNLWVQEEGSPYFPNYTFHLSLYNNYSSSLIESRDVFDLVTIDDSNTSNRVAWVVQNETFELEESDFIQHKDGWYYFHLMFSGSAINPKETGNWYQGLVQHTFFWDDTTLLEVQMTDSFTHWGPLPTESITSDDTDTTHNFISVSMLSIFVAGIVLTLRKRKRGE